MNKSDPVRGGIGMTVIRSQRQREVGIHGDKLLMPLLLRQQLNHLRRPGMDTAQRLVHHAAGGGSLRCAGIRQPLHREGGAAQIGIKKSRSNTHQFSSGKSLKILFFTCFINSIHDKM